MKNQQYIVEQLGQIDYEKLPISDYNKQYIGNLKPVFPYVIDIYEYCLTELLKEIEKPLREIVLVDYGGGSGFLSIYAKSKGFKQVIYVDLNPNSVEAIRVLKETIGIGPDIILEGGAICLKQWCDENNVCPDLLLATDLIEHVYDLNEFFEELYQINSRMQMVFTTASNPYNFLKNKKLRAVMLNAERGSLIDKNFYTLRYEFIQREYPSMPKDEVQMWARKTRGLKFQDIKEGIETNTISVLVDKYNTCDPRNGNWTERILPISEYKKIIQPYGYDVSLKKGFYCVYKGGKERRFIVKAINAFIRFSGKLGLCFSPFILIKYTK